MYKRGSKLNFGTPIVASPAVDLHVPSKVPFCWPAVVQLKTALLARLFNWKDGPESEVGAVAAPGAKDAGGILYVRNHFSTCHDVYGLVLAAQFVEAFDGAATTVVLTHRSGRAPVLVRVGMHPLLPSTVVQFISSFICPVARRWDLFSKEKN
jgi:hypothetical protein